jgi:hypothetical protein
MCIEKGDVYRGNTKRRDHQLGEGFFLVPDKIRLSHSDIGNQGPQARRNFVHERFVDADIMRCERGHDGSMNVPPLVASYLCQSQAWFLWHFPHGKKQRDCFFFFILIL